MLIAHPTTPRGDEHNSINFGDNITYDPINVKKWPKSGTDSAKTPKINSQSQHLKNSENRQIITDSNKNNHKNCSHQSCTKYIGQNKTDSDLAEIVAVWPKLPEHIKQAINTLIQTSLKEKEK